MQTPLAPYIVTLLDKLEECWKQSASQAILINAPAQTICHLSESIHTIIDSLNGQIELCAHNCEASIDTYVELIHQKCILGRLLTKCKASGITSMPDAYVSLQLDYEEFHQYKSITRKPG